MTQEKLGWFWLILPLGIALGIGAGMMIPIQIIHLERTTIFAPPKDGCICIEELASDSEYVYYWDCRGK